MIRDAFYTSNPETSIKINGETYVIHMTFKNKSDAMEEALDLKDHFIKARVVKWEGVWAVYEKEE